MELTSEQLLDIFLKRDMTKSNNEVNQVIRILFATPKILLQRIHNLRTPGTPEGESGLDLPQIFKLYENIGLMGKNNEILNFKNKSFDQMQGEAALKAFLKSANEMKYFFVVSLWNKLFTCEQYEVTLFRLLELIQKAEYYHQIFSKWLDDLPSAYLKEQVKSLNAVIARLCTRLNEFEGQQHKVKVLADQCQWTSNFMKMLYTSNKSKKRLEFSEFNNSFATKMFQPVEQFKRVLVKAWEFNMVNYPFLLDFDYKYKLMQIESIYEQKMNIRKNMSRGLSAIIQEHDFSGGFSLEGLIYLCIAVNRSNILDDSMEKLGKIKQNLKSPLRIEFIGEEGTDEGGVKNEYFQLVTKAIFNPYLDMFLPKNNGRFYWFNGYSYEIPLRFEFVGMLLGLSLYNSVHLDTHFPEVIYKKLLNKNYEEDYGTEIIEDLKEIDPDTHRTLSFLLTTTEPVDQMELYFNVLLERFGQVIVEELVEDGNFIKVTNDNKDYYCLLYADYILNKHVAKQFAPFKRGFYKVVSGAIIDTFEPEELRTLINGNDEISIKELEESTNYEGGYTPQTPVIRYLWEVLHSLNHKEKKQFLTFVTGTDRVPIQGVKSLKFLIQRHANSANLPTAHTCFNVLLLPQYESRDILERNVRLCLEHNQGFGLI